MRRGVFVIVFVVAAFAQPAAHGGQETGPPNPRFTACRTATKLIVDYRFAIFPAGRDRRRTKYPPLTYRTTIRKRFGRVIQPLGLGNAPWRVFLSVLAPSGKRSPTIDRPLSRCRGPA